MPALTSPWSRVIAACAAFVTALAVLLPTASAIAPHVDESQYLWSASYYTRRVMRGDLLSRGEDPYLDPGWSADSYWALTQPMGTRLIYGLAICLTGLPVPDAPFQIADGGGSPVESPIPPETLRLSRLVAVLLSSAAFALLTLRWRWSGAAWLLCLAVPHVRADLARAWAEPPLLFGFALAAAAWRTRWFPYVCGVAATFKLTALILWAFVFFRHPIGNGRFSRLTGLLVPAGVWTLLTPPSWQFGGPLYVCAMIVNRAREELYHSSAFGGPLGLFLPSRYLLPLECAALVVLATLVRRLSHHARRPRGVLTSVRCSA
jgi:hypothetical protein